jgi:hypothetical protein
MGQEIVYCWKCNNRILGSDFDKGKAVQVGNHASCLKCAPELLALQPKAAKPLPTATPRAMPRNATSVSLRAQPAKGPNLVVAGAGGAAVALVLVLIVVASRSGSTPPPAAVGKSTSSEISPKEKSAREAAAKAKAVTEVEARVKAWQDVVFASEGTSVFDVAKRELKEALARRAEAVDVDFRRLDEESRVPARQEEFGKALELLEAGKKRHDDQDWRLRIDKLAVQLRKSAEELLPPLLEKAATAKRTGSKTELKAVEDRVSRWGLPALADLLRTSLVLVPSGGVYQQGADGLLVIEAENYTANTPMSGQSWTAVTEPAGCVGGAMRTQEQGKKASAEQVKQSPRLEYRVNFVKTGRHYFWWRGYGADSGSNSIHAGIDRLETPSLKDLDMNPGAWIWVARQGMQAEGGPAFFEIDKPGPRTLLIYMREDGAHVDRLVITPDPKWTPKGTGPPESPR